MKQGGLYLEKKACITYMVCNISDIAYHKIILIGGEHMGSLKKLNLVLLLLMASLFLTAQAGQTGAIRGVVSMPDGSAFPGITVILKSPALIMNEIIQVTNERGAYQFLNLSPGTYELSFDSDLITRVNRKGIVVNANISATVNMVVDVKKLAEEISVEGMAPTIDVQSVAKVNTISSELLKALPASRNLGAYMTMTPGVTGSLNAISANGASVRDNSWNLDGVQNNDPVVGNSGAQISMDIVEELSVQTAGLDASTATGTGVMVNVVTKSGGNKLSGSLSAYINHESLQSDNTKGTTLEGTASGNRYEYEPGLTLGGALVKNKLWFFTNFSLKQSSWYIPGFPYDKPADQGTPIIRKNLSPYVKLTFQPGVNDKFVASFNYYDNSVNYSADRYHTEETAPSYEAPEILGSFHWIRNFSMSFISTLKLGFFHKTMNWIPQNTNPGYWDDTNYRYVGNLTWSIDRNTRSRIQADLENNLFVDDFLGNHDIKFGVQATRGYGLLDRYQMYGPKDEKGFVRCSANLENGEIYYGDFFQPYKYEKYSNTIGAFFTDTWTVNKNIVLTLGVRFDYSNNVIPVHDSSNTPVPQGDFGYIGYPEVSWNMLVPEPRTLLSWSNFTPRLGLVYDPIGKGRTLFKINASRYLHEAYSHIGFDLHPVNWVGYGAYLNSDGSVDSIDYTWVSGGGFEMGYKGSKLKAPYTNELALAFEQELWEDVSLKLGYTRRWDRNLIETVDSTYLDVDHLLNTGELKWNYYEQREIFNPNENEMITFWHRTQYVPSKIHLMNPPGAERDFHGIDVQINKRYSRGWALNASYSYNHSTGLIGNTFWDSEGRTGLFTNPNAHINADGRMPMERRHQGKIQGMVRAPWGINLSGTLQVLSGYGMDRTINTRNLGFYRSYTVFAEPRGSALLPTLTRLDLRVSKEFKLNAFAFEVFCDIFNMFNASTVTNWTTDSSHPTIAYKTITGMVDPRIFRFGTKLSF